MNDNEKRGCENQYLDEPLVLTNREDRLHDVAIVGTLAVMLGMATIGVITTAIDLLITATTPRSGIDELHRQAEVRQPPRSAP